MRLKLMGEDGKPLMKDGKPVFQTVKWEDHMPNCMRCQEVDPERTSSYIHACAQGSALLMELAVEKQRPAQREKDKAVLEWAKKAGVFKIK